MNWDNVAFDWNQARAFLVSAEAGSFSAAARMLGLSQPTLSRQVAGLEQALGVTLFERAGRSLGLTGPGRELLEHFQEMGAAALRISLGASGRAQEVSGKVSISATDTYSTWFLPRALRRIAEEAPGIEIELVVTDRFVDIGRREADIAIRHARPYEEHLVARLLREAQGHLYASSAWLDRIGRPQGLDDLRRVDFVGFAPVERFHQALASIGLPLDSSQFRVVTDSGVTMCELVRQGFGIGVMIEEVGDAMPGLERVPAEIGPIAIPVWLATHRELYTSKRIRLVFDILAEELSQKPSGIAPLP
jgi:DNA-binding transcriptional LysR family regulator